MRLDREQVLHIAELAKLALTDTETELFSEQLSQIFDHFEILNRLDTSSLPPTAQAIYLRNVMRPDVVRPSITPNEALANAPQRKDDLFQVNQILD
jgi:aspartyl-tRNA(Asn)/glutamyl-tRNA(Gln) amidotransferase subunit C